MHGDAVISKDSLELQPRTVGVRMTYRNACKGGPPNVVSVDSVPDAASLFYIDLVYIILFQGCGSENRHAREVYADYMRGEKARRASTVKAGLPESRLSNMAVCHVESQQAERTSMGGDWRP